METTTAIAPGVYYDMPAADYHAAPGLSCSGMADLEVSPLRYWYLHINPERPEREETSALEFGTALHTLALEPSAFADRYAQELDVSAHGDSLLRTATDLKAWLKERGSVQTGDKATLMARVKAIDPDAPVFDLMDAAHREAAGTRKILDLETWDRVHAAAGFLRQEPEFMKLLEGAKFEVSIFAEHPDTGVLLKMRADILHPEVTGDVKTFAQKRGKSINRSVADAIIYEGYHHRAYAYTKIRKLAMGGGFVPFVLAFVESEQPHETRIVQLQEMDGGEPNLYWQKARVRFDRMVNAYAACMARFGDRPWREKQYVSEASDRDLPAAIWSD